MGEMQFKGWWSAEEKDDAEAPWETFSVTLFGNEAGDWVDFDKVKAVLDASGYELILRKKGEQK